MRCSCIFAGNLHNCILIKLCNYVQVNGFGNFVCHSSSVDIGALQRRTPELQNCSEVTVYTTEGDIVLSLYNDTPLHRRNFFDNVGSGVYYGRTFNRVVEGFVIQCGEEEDVDVIPAEIRYPKYFHRRGVLAMGRCTADEQRELKSSKEQFYIACGVVTDSADINRQEAKMMKRNYGRYAMDSAVCDYYLRNRGIPALDGAFTIFGEVKDGLDVVERIEHVPTNDERPLTDVTVLKAIVTKDADTGGLACMAPYADAFCLAGDVKPHISFDGDSLYTIHDWYGVKGYDVCFRVTSVNDSSVIDVVNADMERDGYYYVKTGLPDKPIATIYPGLFAGTNTICSGFRGNADGGTVWAYTYLYTPDRRWCGGHLYKLMSGDSRSGRLHFRMTAYSNDDAIVGKPDAEYVFTW